MGQDSGREKPKPLSLNRFGSRRRESGFKPLFPYAFGHAPEGARNDFATPFRLAATALLVAAVSACAAEATYPLTVLPAEHKIMKDPVTGTELIFVTTDPGPDHNLYFHQRSWLADSSLLLFTSGRRDGGLMGYLFATGELVRIATPTGGLNGVTACRDRNSVFGVRGREIVELALKIEPSPDPAKAPSKVTGTERVIGVIREGMGANTALNENSDGSLLAAGVDLTGGDSAIIVIGVKTGRVRQVCRLKQGTYAGHVQFSHGSPYLLSYAGIPDRLMVVDIRDGKPRAIHPAVKDEFITHECWWVGDTMTYCGGFVDGQAHVEAINVFTGEVRIVGTGSWWPEAGKETTQALWTTPDKGRSKADLAELARVNWWHASAHESGRWVAADNWHGIIALFDGHTTQPRVLTMGHRIYGHGEHPEVGWDRRGERVVITSNMFGNPDVCVATIPRPGNSRPSARPRSPRPSGRAGAALRLERRARHSRAR